MKTRPAERTTEEPAAGRTKRPTDWALAKIKERGKKRGGGRERADLPWDDAETDDFLELYLIHFKDLPDDKAMEKAGRVLKRGDRGGDNRMHRLCSNDNGGGRHCAYTPVSRTDRTGRPVIGKDRAVIKRCLELKGVANGAAEDHYIGKLLARSPDDVAGVLTAIAFPAGKGFGLVEKPENISWVDLCRIVRAKLGCKPRDPEVDG